MAGARRFEDLDAWRLANEIRLLAIALSERPQVARHLRYRDQLTDAASSAARNIAEGFGRYRHKEFAHLVRVAKGSENEVLDLFHEALQRGFLTEVEFAEHERMTRQAIAAATGLLKYLEGSPDR
jgi:four helix bundle protein